jgi:hypothetical protein
MNVLGADYTQDLTISEGLLGGMLPIIIYVFEVTEALRWEMTVAPDPNPEGNHEQRVMFRFLRIEASSRFSR